MPRSSRSITLCATLLFAAACGSADVSTPTTVVIPRGSAFRAVADSLESAGVIGSARVFRWYASFNGRDRAIKAGTYQINKGESWSNVLDALVEGRAMTRTVTIPEGFDLRGITPLLAKSLELPEDSVRAAIADTMWISRLQIPVGSLEGYLFPDTYTFPSGTNARDAVKAMVERFLEVWKPEWDARLQAMAISRHDAVTMASIVEKEARVPAERPIIAAVYWNRIKAPMRLQADPTVQYALPQHVARVMYKDLDVDSKYNTYRNDGLPPGPIASPGEASIDAALNPAPVSYLFFVAHPDGHHEFRNTFAEHQQAIAMVRRAAANAAATNAAAKPAGDRSPASKPK